MKTRNLNIISVTIERHAFQLLLNYLSLFVYALVHSELNVELATTVIVFSLKNRPFRYITDLNMPGYLAIIFLL